MAAGGGAAAAAAELTFDRAISDPAISASKPLIEIIQQFAEFFDCERSRLLAARLQEQVDLKEDDSPRVLARKLRGMTSFIDEVKAAFHGTISKGPPAQDARNTKQFQDNVNWALSAIRKNAKKCKALSDIELSQKAEELWRRCRTVDEDHTARARETAGKIVTSMLHMVSQWQVFNSLPEGMRGSVLNNASSMLADIRLGRKPKFDPEKVGRAILEEGGAHAIEDILGNIPGLVSALSMTAKTTPDDSGPAKELMSVMAGLEDGALDVGKIAGLTERLRAMDFGSGGDEDQRECPSADDA